MKIGVRSCSVSGVFSRTPDASVRRRPSGLLHDVRQRVVFVHQPELPVRILRSRPDSSRCRRRASSGARRPRATRCTACEYGRPSAGSSSFRCWMYRCIRGAPPAEIPLVHAVDASTLRDPDVLVGEQEFADARIEREPVHAVTGASTRTSCSTRRGRTRPPPAGCPAAARPPSSPCPTAITRW